MIIGHWNPTEEKRLMHQLDSNVLQTFVERLNANLMDEAQRRADRCGRGLERPEVGGLIVQKYSYGMAAAVEVLPELLRQRIPGQVEHGAAVSIVDPAWRENMHRRWNTRAELDFSQPRARED